MSENPERRAQQDREARRERAMQDALDAQAQKAPPPRQAKPVPSSGPQKIKPPAGWYPHPSMVETQRYWDGTTWTEAIAPAEPARPQRSAGPGVLTIARGVALGGLILLAALWFINEIATSNDGMDCAVENVERTQDGLPPLQCPD